MRPVVAFDAELRLILLAISGTVDGDSLVAVLKQIAERSPPFDPVGVVWDFRDADLAALDLEGMRSAWDARTPRTRPTVRRIALVATGEAEKLLLRLWAYGAHPRDSRDRRVFADHAAACAWAAGISGDDSPATC